jgi:hypothetical protein
VDPTSTSGAPVEGFVVGISFGSRGDLGAWWTREKLSIGDVLGLRNKLW